MPVRVNLVIAHGRVTDGVKKQLMKNFQCGFNNQHLKSMSFIGLRGTKNYHKFPEICQQKKGKKPLLEKGPPTSVTYNK